MNHFFCFLSNGKDGDEHEIRYFDADQRRDEVVAEPDDWRTLRQYYNIEKEWGGYNIHWHNPFTGGMNYASFNCTVNFNGVQEALKRIAFESMFEGLEIDGFRKFIEQVDKMTLLDCHGHLCGNCETFWSRSAANSDALEAFRDDGCDTIFPTVCREVRATAVSAGRYNLIPMLQSVIFDTVAEHEYPPEVIEDFEKHATLYAFVHFAGRDLNIPKYCMEFAEWMWRAWEEGYGVAIDVDGVPYCYGRV